MKLPQAIIPFVLALAPLWQALAQTPGEAPHPPKGRNLEIHGEARLRVESKSDYDFSGGSQSYWLSRFRVNGRWELWDGVKFFAEGQDARVHGEDGNGSPSVDPDKVPNSFENPFDLRQAYFDYSPGSFGLRIGRQKIRGLYDRLFGTKEWRNTSLVFDGVLLQVPSEKRGYHFFSVRSVPTLPGEFDDWRKTGNRLSDSDLSGIVVEDPVLLPGAGLKYFWMFRHNNLADDAVHTFGGVFNRAHGSFTTTLEAALQTGEYGEDDHQAWMLAMNVSKELGGIGDAAFGYAYASGDGDPSDGKHGTFDNTLPLNHKYYGQMDFFALQNHHSIEASLSREVVGGTNFRVAYNAFWLDEPDTDSWYNSGMKALRTSSIAGTDPFVGSEVDLSLRFQTPWDITLHAGASRFFAGDYVSQTGNGADEDPTFFYLSLATGF